MFRTALMQLVGSAPLLLALVLVAAMLTALVLGAATPLGNSWPP